MRQSGSIGFWAMFENRDQSIFDLLSGRGMIPQDQLDALRDEPRLSGRSLADAVVASGFITTEDLLSLVAESLGHRCAKELTDALSPLVLAAVTADLARGYGIVPVSVSPTRSPVALSRASSSITASSSSTPLSSVAEWI